MSRLGVIKTRRGKLDVSAVRLVRRRFGKYLRPHWKAMTVAFAATLGAVGMNVLSPWPIKIIFDVVLTDRMGDSALGGWFARNAPTPMKALIVVCVSVLLIAITQSALVYLRDVQLAQTGQSVVGKLRHDLFRHMQRLSPDVFETRRTGDLLLRMTGDIQMLRQTLVNAGITAAENLLTIVATVAIMFWLNPLLAVVATATIPLIVWSAARISKQIRKATKSQREKESLVASIAHEVIGAIMVVQAFNREKIELRRFARQNRSSMRAGVRTTRLEARMYRIVILASACALCAVLFLGVRSVIAGAMTPGDLLVFVAYVKTLNKPMRKLSKLAGQTAKATACGMRIAEIMSIPRTVQDAPDAIAAVDLEGRIELDHVSFTYPDGTPALNGVSLRIKPGECVAVVGRSGAGKSTLMKLLLRFYDVTEGEIRIDGVDIRRYAIASLRDQIAIVQQGTVLFGMSIAENIALGTESVDMDEVRAAAKAVGAHEFIKALPRKYETVLSEKGMTLSGGQMQRIALARAMLRRAPLLILDEPVTGLDSMGVRSAEESVLFQENGRTTLVICHDMSSMDRFDRIVVLDQGSVMGVGGHARLLAGCDQYAELFEAWRSRRGGIPTESADAGETERLAC